MKKQKWETAEMTNEIDKIKTKFVIVKNIE